MKPITVITIALIISASLLATKVSPAFNTDQFQEGTYIHIDQMVISFDRTEASVTIDYQLTPFARAYIFLFGSRHMEPQIREVFSDFDNVTIENIGWTEANLKIGNFTRLAEANYLHDSHKLGIQPDTLTVIYPDGVRRTTAHPKETPNIFYPASGR